MNEKIKQTTAARIAHIISDFFCPLLVPTYGCFIALWLTRMAYLPLGIRLWTLVGIAAITAIAPATVIFVLIKLGKVSNTCISNRHQRTIPYLASIVCYIGACVFLTALKAPAWLVVFFVGAGVISFVSMIVNRWWKISAHTAGVASLAGALFWLARTGLIVHGALIWVSVAFILVGIMAWARLYLQHHTLMQTFAGSVLGFGVELGLLYLL